VHVQSILTKRHLVSALCSRAVAIAAKPAATIADRELRKT